MQGLGIKNSGILTCFSILTCYKACLQIFHCLHLLVYKVNIIQLTYFIGMLC